MCAEVVQDVHAAERAVVVDGVCAELPVLVRAPPALGDIQDGMIEREQQAVRAGRIEGDAVDRPWAARTRIESVDGIVVEILVRGILAPWTA